jgi:LacI family transcriptional regulator
MNIPGKKGRKHRPTQSDVARLAGVSQTTVSFIVNDPEHLAIPDETRRRVLEVIQRLGYVPDRNARSLRTQKTYTIAAIIPDITNPFYPAFIRGIQKVTNQQSYDLIIYNTDGVLEEEEKCLSSVKQNHVDGLIVAAFHLHEEQLLETGIPLVHINRVNGAAPVLDSIFVDSVGMARAAVEHLIERGHTRIGMIAGTLDSPPGTYCVQGYRQALVEHDLPLDERLIYVGDFTEPGGEQAMQRLLEEAPRVTAAFAANDLMAMGALSALRKIGLKVPQDVALIGIDDIPAARLISPPLTTINQFQESLGQRAAEMLFSRLDGTVTGDPYAVEMPFSLVIRESSGAMGGS